jgi:hypothetical protein
MGKMGDTWRGGGDKHKDRLNRSGCDKKGPLEEGCQVQYIVTELMSCLCNDKLSRLKFKLFIRNINLKTFHLCKLL